MALLSDLLNLNLSDCTDKIIAEYIWVGGSGIDIRSKARTLSGPVNDPSKLPKWNYDGSSTGQAPGEDSEVILYPQAIFRDPFRRGNNILVRAMPLTKRWVTSSSGFLGLPLWFLQEEGLEGGGGNGDCLGGKGGIFSLLSCWEMGKAAIGFWVREAKSEE
ncbi:hypothetical protein SLEP1_g23095 [Rubroshorea leprosula]|uniref:GS beta-grasp domain-containing protein n=1 Tax=Rubroshorea leprosula TaxID=152421 RepID=A0AAV5JEB5_9ROSI|nr:hypothetical protein SLEP1_g23095 [Rubroshorea leprosula]